MSGKRPRREALELRPMRPTAGKATAEGSRAAGSRKGPDNTRSVSEDLTKSVIERRLDGALVLFQAGAEVKSIEPAQSANLERPHGVFCSRAKPTRSASVGFRTFNAAEEIYAVIDRIRGKKVYCDLDESIDGSDDGEHPHTILIQQMSASTTEFDLKKTLHHLSASGRSSIRSSIGNSSDSSEQGDNNEFKICNISGPSHDLAPPEAEALIQAELPTIGTIGSWHTNPWVNASRVTARVYFSSDEEVQGAIQSLHGKQMSTLGDSKLFVAQLFSSRVLVERRVYEVSKWQLEALQGHLFQNKDGAVYIESEKAEDHLKGLVKISVFGKDGEEVALVKVAIEKIMLGSVPSIRGSRLWNKAFLDPRAFTHIKEIERSGEFAIGLDLNRRFFRLHGKKENKQKAMMELIRWAALQPFAHQSTKTLDDRALERLRRGALERIRADYGSQSVFVNLTAVQKTITFYGPHESWQKVDNLVFEADFLQPADDDLESKKGKGKGKSIDTPSSICSVCFSKRPHKPFNTSCGHIYCDTCFVDHCRATDLDGNPYIPVICAGDLGECREPFSLYDLRKGLKATEFERLLQAALTSHLIDNHKTYLRCVTSTCSQIFKHTEDGTVWICPACETQICTTCHCISHDPIACGMYEKAYSAFQLQFEKWKRQNAHVFRKCPNCKATLNRTTNFRTNFTCGACYTDICWICMEVYDDSKECYKHVYDKHRNLLSDVRTDMCWVCLDAFETPEELAQHTETEHPDADADPEVQDADPEDQDDGEPGDEQSNAGQSEHEGPGPGPPEEEPARRRSRGRNCFACLQQ